MTLKELIKRGKLEEFDEASLMQVASKLKFAFTNLNTAENLLKFDLDSNNYNATLATLGSHIIQNSNRAKDLQDRLEDLVLDGKMDNKKRIQILEQVLQMQLLTKCTLQLEEDMSSLPEIIRAAVLSCVQI